MPPEVGVFQVVKLVPLLVEAIKEQQTQIQSLQEELRSMRSRLGS